MKKVIVFDLDDTLYNELSYVKSGFLAVAQYLFVHHGIQPDESYAFMIHKLKDGRGRIFDEVLIKYKIYKKSLVKQCISIYRMHRPDIYLDQDAAFCLNNLLKYPLYIVTDGNKIVQKNKIISLGLLDKVKFCFITHRYGLKHAKPSPYCFLKICDLENTKPQNVVYVGDNPHKDFVGIKPLGFKTIRIRKGQYKNVLMPENYEAQFIISSLFELNQEYLNFVFKDL